MSSKQMSKPTAQGLSPNHKFLPFGEVLDLLGLQEPREIIPYLRSGLRLYALASDIQTEEEKEAYSLYMSSYRENGIAPDEKYYPRMLPYWCHEGYCFPHSSSKEFMRKLNTYHPHDGGHIDYENLMALCDWRFYFDADIQSKDYNRFEGPKNPHKHLENLWKKSFCEHRNIIEVVQQVKPNIIEEMEEIDPPRIKNKLAKDSPEEPILPPIDPPERKKFTKKKSESDCCIQWKFSPGKRDELLEELVKIKMIDRNGIPSLSDRFTLKEFYQGNSTTKSNLSDPIQWHGTNEQLIYLLEELKNIDAIPIRESIHAFVSKNFLNKDGNGISVSQSRDAKTRLKDRKIKRGNPLWIIGNLVSTLKSKS